MAAGRWGINGYKDLTGLRFGRLTVLSLDHDEPIQKYGGSKYFWNCVCECGKERIVRGDCLRSGNTKSCGCIQLEHIAKLAIARTLYKDPIEAAQRAVYASFTGAAKTRKIPCELSFVEWLSIVTKPCVYTGQIGSVNRQKFKIKDLRINGVDRKDSSKGYTKENSQSCIPAINVWKSDLSEEDFIKYICLVYNYLHKNTNKIVDFSLA